MLQSNKMDKKQSDYVAFCCDEPMHNMGLWPRRCTIAAWSEMAADGSRTCDLGEQSECYTTTYHCLKCNRYIGLSWDQTGRRDE